jgi:hypothetical protein
VPPTKAAPSIRSALRLERVPLANPFARASKEISLVSSLIGYVPFSKKGGTLQPATFFSQQGTSMNGYKTWRYTHLVYFGVA